MNRGPGRMMVLGLLAGGALTAGGCFYREQEEEGGGPHTPIQEKYKPEAGAAAEDLGPDREGLAMPDWQEHPTAEEGQRAE
ncbi:MAG TPA: hypothetical protein VLQ93_14625, partial [Myxococcaceae bacterium]|nr:hypothetical protein [Myxococcaceae bacterium]